MCKSDTSLSRLNAEIKASLNELTDDNVAVLVMFNPSCQARLNNHTSAHFILSYTGPCM